MHRSALIAFRCDRKFMTFKHSNECFMIAGQQSSDVLAAFQQTHLQPLDVFICSGNFL